MLFRSFAAVLASAATVQAVPKPEGDCKETPTSSQTPYAGKPSGPIATLKPAVHWNTNTKQAKNVLPVPAQEGNKLYYGLDDPSKAGSYAFLTYHFNQPSVNLDQAGSIKDIVYSDAGLAMTFDTEEAYKIARENWLPDEEMVLITYTEGCGDYDHEDRCYFKTSGFTYDDQAHTVLAKGAPGHPQDLVSYGESEWGWWSPDADDEQPVAAAGFAAAVNNAGDAASPSAPAPSPSRKTRSGCIAPAGKDGLPAACFGKLFDLELDDQHALKPLSAEQKAFIDKVSNKGVSADATIVRRCGWFCRAFEKVKTGVKEAFDKVQDVVENVVEDVKEVADDVQDKIDEIATFSGDFDHDFSYKLPDLENPDPLATMLLGGTIQAPSPWGPAILLKSFGVPEDIELPAGVDASLNVYCVNCGVSGTARIAGRATWTPSEGVTEGQVELFNDMQIMLQIGVDAKVAYKYNFETELFGIGLPGLSFGVITIGPRISIGAEAALEAAASGRLLTGAELSLQGAHVLIDLVNSENTKADAWQPSVKPILEVEGDIRLSASLGLPVGLKFGIQIAGFDLSAGIVNKPSVTGVAQVTASIGLGDDGGFEAGFKETNGCTGISSQLSWRNALTAEVTGLTPLSLFDTGDNVLARGCIELPAIQPIRRAMLSGNKYHNARVRTAGSDKVQSMLVDVTAQNKIEGASQNVTYSVKTLPPTSYKSTDGYDYSTVTNPTGSSMLAACSNGNVYSFAKSFHLPACSAMWATVDRTLVADGSKRVMHYYKDTMSTLGVSRLRLRDQALIPESGAVVAWAPYTESDKDNEDYLYIAVDEQDNVFYPMVCEYEESLWSEGAKLFLVADPEKGAETLKSIEAQHTVTGGLVKGCYPLSLKQGVSSGGAYEKYGAKQCAMKVIVTGATGMAGREVVKRCLEEERITEVVILTRRPLVDDVQGNPKARVIMHDDFSTYPDDLMEALAGAEACIWTIGGRVDQFNNDKALCRRVGVDFTLSAANTMLLRLKTAVPAGRKFRFVFLSGKYAEWDQTKTLLFLADTRRIKGEVERALCVLADAHGAGVFETWILRPSGFLPPEPSLARRLVGGLYSAVDTPHLARVLVQVALDGASERILENDAILKIYFDCLHILYRETRFDFSRYPSCIAGGFKRLRPRQVALISKIYLRLDYPIPLGLIQKPHGKRERLWVNIWKALATMEGLNWLRVEMIRRQFNALSTEIHQDYAAPIGVDTNYLTMDGSTTKWIGVNTNYLTEETRTTTIGNIETTTVVRLQVAVVTATKASEGVNVGDVTVLLSESVRNELEGLVHTAAALCGIEAKLRRRDGMSCVREALKTVAQNKNVLAVFNSEHLENLRLSIAQNAPEGLLNLVSYLETPAELNKFILMMGAIATTGNVAMKTVAHKFSFPEGEFGRPKDPKENENGSDKDRPTTTKKATMSTWTSTTSSTCNPSATVDENSEKKNCPCVHWTEPMIEGQFDRDWADEQQEILKELEDKLPEIIPPNCFPNSYKNDFNGKQRAEPATFCHCSSQVEVGIMTRGNFSTMSGEGEKACAYSVMPTKTISISVKPKETKVTSCRMETRIKTTYLGKATTVCPDATATMTSILDGTPTEEPHCYATHGPPHDNPEMDQLIRLCDARLPEFAAVCRTDASDVIEVRCPGMGTLPRGPISDNKYLAWFVKADNAPEDCNYLFRQGDYKNDDEVGVRVDSLCIPAFDAIRDHCPWNGGEVKNHCGTFKYQSCTFNRNCPPGAPSG
ncbi:Leucinostatins biosynthesis cluster protein T [Paramyrothecium foliicola]|nr:Leucinostatins biosynthesis cluster protein T [Paramyrothecium foliicola]